MRKLLLLGATMPAVSHALAYGSLLGARGNSGVILSQILRGISSVVADAGGLDAVSGSSRGAA